MSGCGALSIRKGETGSFLICTFNDAASAKSTSEMLRSEGISTAPQGVTNIVMEDWGLHLYYNILSLVHRTSNDRSGFPWNLAENKDSTARYERGTCPRADDLFARSSASGYSFLPFSPGRNRHHHRVYQRFLPLNALSCRFLAMRAPCATLSPDSKKARRVFAENRSLIRITDARNAEHRIHFASVSHMRFVNISGIIRAK